jgi:hypothetical protein
MDIDQEIKNASGKTTNETIENLTFMIKQIIPIDTEESFYKLTKLHEARKIEMISLLPRPLIPIGSKIIVDDKYDSHHGIIGTVIGYLDYNDPRRIMVEILPVNRKLYRFAIDIRLTQQN